MNKQRNYSTSSILNNPKNSSITRHYSPSQGALLLDEETNNAMDLAMARLNTSLNNLDIASSSSSSSCSNKMGVGSFINNIDNCSNILLKNHINNNTDCQLNENDLDIYQTNDNKKVINITNNISNNRNNSSFNSDVLTINTNNNMDEKKNKDETNADILIENTNLNDSTSTITSKQSSSKLKTSKLIKMFQPTSNNNDINNNNNNIDLLPPLPSSSTTSSSSSTNLSKSSSLNNGSTQSNNSNTSGTDFDRNLHLRRSKRYGRQLQQPNNIIIQDININNNDTNSSISSSEHSSPTTYNSPSPSIVISSLTKAISTPSILDKLNNDSTNVKTSTVKINTSEDLISDNNNNNNNNQNNQNDISDLVEDTTSTTGKHSKSVASLVDSSSNKIISSNFHSQILPTCSSTNLNQSTNEDLNNNDSLNKKAAKKAIQTINSYKLINSSSNLTMDNSCNIKKFAQNSSNGSNDNLFCFSSS
jgi:hypothetical protein